jgi:hypothetical protein
LTIFSEGAIMKETLEIYGVKRVRRPHIKATKKLNLNGDIGEQLIKSETKLVLRTHEKTFRKLADM